MNEIDRARGIDPNKTDNMPKDRPADIRKMMADIREPLERITREERDADGSRKSTHTLADMWKLRQASEAIETKYPGLSDLAKSFQDDMELRKA